jgi:hypothetical protein
MLRKKNSIVKFTFLIFPLVAVLCTWPLHGMNKVKKVVYNVESSFNKDIETMGITDIDGNGKVSEANKTRSGKGSLWG